MVIHVIKIVLIVMKEVVKKIQENVMTVKWENMEKIVIKLVVKDANQHFVKDQLENVNVKINFMEKNVILNVQKIVFMMKHKEIVIK